ncbi:MAG: 4-hydroxyphenylacetate 3-monooxygenase [Chloroflexi bacterium]|nr:4-hydroxyphenylacetate 3-monooxygenase [Chloroflexota bacterium]
MSLRTGAQYLESLKDGREVWLEGDRVADVTSDPRLAGCARSVAEVYDLQHDPSYRDVLTMNLDSAGEPVSVAYLIPRSTDDLVRHRLMVECLMRRCGGTMGRLPEYSAAMLQGLYHARDILGQGDPAYPGRAERYIEHCRDNDLCLATGFTDPPRDRTRPAEEWERLHVVKRGPDGIVVRGAKAVSTMAPYANEFQCLTSHRPDLRPEEVLYFAVPMATPGLRIICRQPFAHQSREEHPLSAAFDEMDAWIILEDVFVPTERVHFLDRVDLNQPLFAALPVPLVNFHILIRQAVKAEVLAGLCVAIAEYLGLTSQPNAQNAMQALLGYLTTLRAFLFAAEQQPIYSPSGQAIANPTIVNQGRIHAMENHVTMLHMVREICGASLLMTPRLADLRHPEIGPAMRRYIAGTDDLSMERYHLMKLAWDYLGDAFGSRQLMFELHNAGTLDMTKLRFVSAYDKAPLVKLAKELAGIPAGKT